MTPDRRTLGIELIRGMALRLGAERTAYEDDFDREQQSFRLEVGSRSVVVHIRNLDVDHVSSDQAVSDAISGKLRSALADLLA